MRRCHNCFVYLCVTEIVGFHTPLSVTSADRQGIFLIENLKVIMLEFTLKFWTWLEVQLCCLTFYSVTGT